MTDSNDARPRKLDTTRPTPITDYRLIVAGSRSIDDRPTVRQALERSQMPFPTDGEIVTSDDTGGVDAVGRWLATLYETMELTTFEADWDRFGDAAGPVRNGEMADYGDALLAVWDGTSPGTRNMIELALDRGLPVSVTVVGDGDTRTDASSDESVETTSVTLDSFAEGSPGTDEMDSTDAEADDD